MKKLTSLLILLCSMLQVAFSQCSELLRDGLFSYIKEVTNYEDASAATSAIRSAYDEYKYDKQVGKASAKFKQIFKGNAEYSQEQIESIGKMYSEDNFWSNNSNALSDKSYTYVDPNMRAMYEACLKANEAGIQLDIVISDKTTFEDVKISVRQLTETEGDKRYKVTEIICDTSKIALSGELASAYNKQKEFVLAQGYTLHAKRKDIGDKPFNHGNESLIANSHLLTVQLENKAFTVTFPKIYPKAAPKKTEERLKREIAIFEETGLQSGNAVSGFNRRSLNSGASTTNISLNTTLHQITLQPGKYLIQGYAMAFQVDRHQVDFRNKTASGDPIEIFGTNEFSNQVEGTASTSSLLNGIITVQNPTIYILDHLIQSSKGSTDSQGLSHSSISSAANIYARIVIEKL